MTEEIRIYAENISKFCYLFIDYSKDGSKNSNDENKEKFIEEVIEIVEQFIYASGVDEEWITLEEINEYLDQEDRGIKLEEANKIVDYKKFKNK